MNFSLRPAFILALVFFVAVNAEDDAKKTDATAKASQTLKTVSEGLKAGGLIMPANIVGAVGTGVGGGGKRFRRSTIVV